MSRVPKSEAKAAGTESFEASTERLTKIVEELERGDLPLERALALFEEGIRLSRDAEIRITTAERRVEELLGLDAAGKPVTRDLGVTDRDDAAGEPDEA